VVPQGSRTPTFHAAPWCSTSKRLALTVWSLGVHSCCACSSDRAPFSLRSAQLQLIRTTLIVPEAAYDPDEEVAVDNEYEEAMPFRDPGHISRSEIRLAHALARSGTTKKDETWDFIQPLWAKYIQAMRDVSAASARACMRCDAVRAAVPDGVNAPHAAAFFRAAHLLCCTAYARADRMDKPAPSYRGRRLPAKGCGATLLRG
jgi:hypothetical protein